MKTKQQEQILHVLAKAAHSLNEAGIHWALGASMLLYFHGITDVFHDIDIMTTVDDAVQAKDIFLKLGAELKETEENQFFKDNYFYEFTLDGAEIDVMAGMVIVFDEKEHDCAMNVDLIEGYADLENEKIPLYSLKEWRRFYKLMERTSKVEMIDSYEQKKHA